MKIVVEKCEVCAGDSGKVSLFYEGYHIWLCRKCFDKLTHEQLLKLRADYYKNQADM